MVRILLAGDGFVRPQILRDALETAIGDRHEVEYKEIRNDWPEVPFGDVGDVIEAVGDEEEFAAAIADADICVTHTHPVTKRVLEAAPNLKMVTVTRGGPVNCNVPAATERGVLVTYAPGRNAIATAEHTIAMIMAATRQVAQRDAEIRDHQWRSDLYDYDRVPPEIASSTVGLVGCGAVGRRVAHDMAAMGATVLIYNPTPTPRRSRRAGRRPTSWTTCCAAATSSPCTPASPRRPRA